MDSSNEIVLGSFLRRATPTDRPADIYEIRQTGPYNYLVNGGGEQIWTDGIRLEDRYLLEAKYVADPERSPYADGSRVPAFVREAVRNEQEEEFRRYKAILRDPDNQFQGLEVITNQEEAVPYFRQLLVRHDIPGSVVVRT